MAKKRKRLGRRERRRRQARKREETARKELEQKPKRSYKIPVIGTAVAALALTGTLIYHWAAGKRTEYPIRTTTPTEQTVPKQETTVETSPLEEIISELKSYDRDLKRATKEGMDDRISMLKHNFLRCYRAIGDRNNSISKTRREKLQSSFYREWMTERQLYPEALPSGPITFEQVAMDPNPGLRQAYLNQIGHNIAKYGNRAWESLLSIEYDPGFKRLAAKRIELGIPIEGPAAYGFSPLKIELARTPFLYGLNKKHPTWICENAFIYCETEDELLSVIDNEASSAFLCEKDIMHFAVDYDKTLKDVDKYFKHVEIVSFDFQFSRILSGQRKVSPLFVEGLIAPARELFTDIKELAEGDSPDAPYFRALVAAMRARPTIKYFEQN